LDYQLARARAALRVVGDIAVDKGQHFPVALDSKHPWGTVEPGCFQMPQVLVHRERPSRPALPGT
jgi:hypothetical protein